MDKNTVNQKVAVITGGSGGIGKAMALAMAQAGYTVAIWGTNQAKGLQAVAEISAQTDTRVEFYAVNVTDLAAVQAASLLTAQQLGTVTILINNAGITRDNLLMKLTEAEWDQVLTTNLKSIYHTSSSFIRPMLKNRWGRIINISSVVGLMGNAGQTNYAAAKAGMIGFSKSLAREVASRGICVNCIAPGFIETPMTAGLTIEQQEHLQSLIPLKRFGQVADIAHLAVFLASESASYITGQVIAVDGGMTM